CRTRRQDHLQRSRQSRKRDPLRAGLRGGKTTVKSSVFLRNVEIRAFFDKKSHFDEKTRPLRLHIAFKGDIL
ncbi:MAG: hypothetical protein J6S54_08420, partial [Lentisphaeria bacterium]|nr:hypothetical protein [Lentisphaeria bacterium]